MTTETFNVMRVIPKRAAIRLIANWRNSMENQADQTIDGRTINHPIDRVPLVRLHDCVPGAECAWLLTELDPDGFELAFGLHCPWGAPPFYGYVHLPLICDADSTWPAKHDRTFQTKLTLSEHYSRALLAYSLAKGVAA